MAPSCRGSRTAVGGGTGLTSERQGRSVRVAMTAMPSMGRKCAHQSWEAGHSGAWGKVTACAIHVGRSTGHLDKERAWKRWLESLSIFSSVPGTSPVTPAQCFGLHQVNFPATDKGSPETPRENQEWKL